MLKPSLFPEIIDHIIDHLHNDKPSLGACALTCRTWLPTTRFHLFSEIILVPRMSLHVQSFTTLLDAPSPSAIGKVVRHLSLKSLNQNLAGLEANTSVVEDIARLGSLIPSVTSLQLAISDLSEFTTQDIKRMFSNFGHVETLNLDRILLRELDHALEFTYAFPYLRQISLSMVNWLSVEPSYFPLRLGRLREGPKFNVREIALTHWALKEVAEWLHAREPVPSIHTLHARLFEVTPEGHLALHNLLRATGNSIRALKLHFGAISYEPHEGSDRPIDLQHCTRLKVITFANIVLYPPSATVRRTWPVQVLSQISSNLIEEFNLSLHSNQSHNGRECFAAFDWEGVAKALKRPQFDHLKKMRIEWTSYSESSDFEASESLIRTEYLSSLSARGILQVDFKREHRFGGIF